MIGTSINGNPNVRIFFHALLFTVLVYLILKNKSIRFSTENISELYHLKCASYVLMSEPLANCIKSLDCRYELASETRTKTGNELLLISFSFIK
jgi:hypothetical protein